MYVSGSRNKVLSKLLIAVTILFSVLSNVINIKTVRKLCPSVRSHTAYSRVLSEFLCNLMLRISSKLFFRMLFWSMSVEYLE